MVDVFDAALDAQDVAVVLLYQADGTFLILVILLHLGIPSDLGLLFDRTGWPDITVYEST